MTLGHGLPTDRSNQEECMFDIDAAADPRCARPAELDRLLADLNRVLAAVESCHHWRPWLGGWRDRLTDAVSVDGDIVPDARNMPSASRG